MRSFDCFGCICLGWLVGWLGFVCLCLFLLLLLYCLCVCSFDSSLAVYFLGMLVGRLVVC